MAIAFDNALAATTGSGTSATRAFTVGAGTGRLLFVGVRVDDTANAVSGVTYAGVAMTFVGYADQGANGRGIGLYCLANPASGANNIVASFTGSKSYGLVAASYSGAQAGSTVDNSGTNTTGAATTLAKAITPVADKCWVVGVSCHYNTHTFTPNGGTTIRAGNTTATVIFDTNAAVSPAASTSLGLAWTGSESAAMVVASFTIAIATEIVLNGASSVPVSATAALTTTARFTAAAAVALATAATLSSSGPLLASPAIRLASSAALTAAAPLRGAAEIHVTATAQFSIRFEAASSLRVATTATISPSPRATTVAITMGGVDVAARVRMAGLSIRDVVNDAPNTCAITLDGASVPQSEQRLRITLNDGAVVLFDGAVETATESYEGRPGQRVFPCAAQDDTPRANRRLPRGYWENVSATTVAQDLVAFAPGFTAVHVQAGLPAVTVLIDGSEGGLNGALRVLAKLIGGYFYWSSRDLHLFTDETTELPDPIDSTPGRFLNDPPITVTRDDTQIRTRVVGKGHAENTLSEVAIGATLIPLVDTSFFNPAGGQARTAEQILDYTGVQVGGPGSLVGPGAAPSSAPTLTLATGSGVETGAHSYALVFGTAAGRSLPSPLATITVGGGVTPPTSVATLYTFAAGQYTPNGTEGYSPGDTVFVGVTYLDGTGETTATLSASIIAVAHPEFSGYVWAILLPTFPTSPDSTVTAKRVYVNTNGSWVGYTQWAANASGAQWVSDSAGTGSPPGTNTTAPKNQVTYTAALGPTGTTYRELYRTAIGGSQLKLAATIANNTATGGTDALADASLGANALTTDTSGLTLVSGIVNAGAASVPVANVDAFGTSGWAVGSGGLVVQYTGVSATALTGVPASGLGALLAPLTYGTTLTAAPMLTGVTGLTRALIKGAPVHIWVQVDDLAAQAACIAREGEGDGIIEHQITDERRGEASLLALCAADLAQFAYPIVTVRYACRDLKTKSGKPITFNLADPLINETLTIQDVTIDQIDLARGTKPRFTVIASSLRNSVEDLLRRLAGTLWGT
ncbi:MAG: hypothetical protein ABI665_15170 [Vicinamibacterales bacterium]